MAETTRKDFIKAVKKFMKKHEPERDEPLDQYLEEMKSSIMKKLLKKSVRPVEAVDEEVKSSSVEAFMTSLADESEVAKFLAKA